MAHVARALQLATPVAVLHYCPEAILVLPVAATEYWGSLRLTALEAAGQGQGQLCSPAGYRLLCQHADCFTDM